MCLVCDYSCAYFKVFKAMKSSDIHQQALLYYDKSLVVLHYAYAKIYRTVVVDEQMGVFQKKKAAKKGGILRKVEILSTIKHQAILYSH